MGYREAIEAAGAKVVDFKETGSYQGSWGAVIEVAGVRSLAVGSYGSCGGCDAFMGEFDFNDTPSEENGKFFVNWEEVTEEVYRETVSAYNSRLADFGRSYVTTPMSKTDIEAQLAQFDADEWFDEEQKELYVWALTFFNDTAKA